MARIGSWIEVFPEGPPRDRGVMTTLIAHHPVVETLPFVLPMLIVVAGVAFLTVRDRRRARRSRSSETA